MKNKHIEKFENKLPWLTLLSIPAIYVWFLYCFELGYASYFRIPYSLVSIKISEFYAYTTWNGIAIGILIGMVLFTGIFYDIFYKETKFLKTFFIRVIVIMSIRFMLLVYVLWIQYEMIGNIGTTLSYLITIIFLLAIFSSIDYRFMKAPSEITEEQGIIGTVFNRENAYSYFVCTLIIQALIYIPIAYFAIGYNNAHTKNEFLTTTIDGNKKLVISIYDDCCIVKSIEDVENRNNIRFSKADKKQLDGQDLEWMTVTLKDK